MVNIWKTPTFPTKSSALSQSQLHENQPDKRDIQGESGKQQKPG
jgi:hypothetical protein